VLTRPMCASRGSCSDVAAGGLDDWLLWRTSRRVVFDLLMHRGLFLLRGGASGADDGIVLALRVG